MIDIDDRQVTSRFALFYLGFRPFFLGAAWFALLSILIWMGISVFGWEIQLNGMSSNTWHAHEMIYGYSMAVVAGFLLTAVRTWTGIQTLNGFPLVLLFFLWVAGRVLPFFGNLVSVGFVATIDNLFVVLLILSVALPVLKARQWKNFGIILTLLLILASNILFYLGVLGILSDGVYRGLYSGLYLILALIFTMGRRVIPFFIERGVGYHVQLKNWKWVDISSLLSFLLFWIADLLISNQAPVTLLAGILFVLHGVRMVGWYTHGVWEKPLLWVLYLAYGSIVAGFALKVAVFVFEVSPYLSVHAFSFGGIGMITIGMMSRVSLGHTGRSVFKPPAGLSWIFAILFIGAVVRVLFPLVDQSHYTVWIGLSQVLWIISFAMYLYVYSSMLIQPRIDGRYG